MYYPGSGTTTYTQFDDFYLNLDNQWNYMGISISYAKANDSDDIEFTLVCHDFKNSVTKEDTTDESLSSLSLWSPNMTFDITIGEDYDGRIGDVFFSDLY